MRGACSQSGVISFSCNVSQCPEVSFSNRILVRRSAGFFSTFWLMYSSVSSFSCFVIIADLYVFTDIWLNHRDTGDLNLAGWECSCISVLIASMHIMFEDTVWLIAVKALIAFKLSWLPITAANVSFRGTVDMGSVVFCPHSLLYDVNIWTFVCFEIFSSEIT